MRTGPLRFLTALCAAMRRRETALPRAVPVPVQLGPLPPADRSTLVLGACRRAAAIEGRRQASRLNSLANVASAAPLFGVVGTLLGIHGSFRGFSGEKSMILAMFVTFLAESLLFVLLGLAIGITAHLAYLAFRRYHERMALEMETLSLALANALSSR